MSRLQAIIYNAYLLAVLIVFAIVRLLSSHTAQLLIKH
jgi:hypothetical protein